MRSYCAIYVDAGYLLAASATRVTGTSLRRGVRVDHAALIHGLIAQAEAESGLPLLRVNWYDSGGRPGGMPDLQQDHIGMLPRVKLRLGRLSQTGEQKGVDLRMGLDLATYARNRVVDAIYLVSGDDDLTEAVEEAQFHGLQLVILAVPDDRGRPHAVAKNLQREADGVILIEAQTIDANVKSLALDPALIPQGEPAAAPDKAGALPGDDATAPAEEQPAPQPTPGSAPAQTPGPVRGAPEAPAAALPGGPNGIPAGAGKQPAAEEVAASAPKPSVLAGKRATTVVAAKILPRSAPMWSTSTGEGGRGEETDDITSDLIDAVVRQVLVSWAASATPAMLADLRRGEPFIPGDLDRTLLLDLSSRSGVYDIDDASRHELRDQFWWHVQRLGIR